MAELLKAVKGMNDILPPESARWDWLEGRIRTLMHRHGYQGIRTPIVEPTALFVRGLGEVTDIVEKEMYSFEDSMNGDRLSLRPENTAGVVRAMNEHSLLRDGGRRLYYIGPMFRHERPQKGRSRQFHQFGVEALGYPGPDVDAELILMLRAFWTDLGLKVGEDVWLELNSLGQPAERLQHRAALVAYFEQHADALDEDSRRRLTSNPLRILDSKNPGMQALIEAAPRLSAYLGAESLAHFQAVTAVLDAAKVPYRLNPRLVRGMDYYNLTVFEWVTDKLGSQGTVCGGGRYDGLIEQLGGKPSPGVGFGLGMERLLLLLDALNLAPGPVAPDVCAIVPSAAVLTPALCTLDALRAEGVSVLMNAGFNGMKSQFKRADASGATWALIFGEDEVARGEVALKHLRDADRAQRSVSLAAVAEWAAGLRNA